LQEMTFLVLNCSTIYYSIIFANRIKAQYL
jgi:hypothetical protein